MAPVPGAINLVERLRGVFSPGVILEASAYVCEDPYKTQRALEGIVPALLLGLMHHFHGSSLLSLVVNRTAPAEAQAMLGAESTVMTEWIASEVGFQQESAASLLSLAAPKILEALRRLQSERNLGAGAMESVLQAHRKRVVRMLPGSLAERLEAWR